MTMIFRFGEFPFGILQSESDGFATRLLSVDLDNRLMLDVRIES